MANAIADHILLATIEHRLLATPDLRSTPDCLETAQVLAQTLRSSEPTLLQRILIGGTIAPRHIALDLDPQVVAEALRLSSDAMSPGLTKFTAPLQLRRRGVEASLVIGTPTPEPDPVLIRILAEAHRWVAALRDGMPLSQVANDAGHHDAYIRTRAPLAFLTPKIQIAILDGTLPPALTLRQILQSPIPLDWQEQERRYGF